MFVSFKRDEIWTAARTSLSRRDPQHMQQRQNRRGPLLRQKRRSRSCKRPGWLASGCCGGLKQTHSTHYRRKRRGPLLLTKEEVQIVSARAGWLRADCGLQDDNMRKMVVSGLRTVRRFADFKAPKMALSKHPAVSLLPNLVGLPRRHCNVFITSSGHPKQ